MGTGKRQFLWGNRIRDAAMGTASRILFPQRNWRLPVSIVCLGQTTGKVTSLLFLSRFRPGSGPGSWLVWHAWFELRIGQETSGVSFQLAVRIPRKLEAYATLNTTGNILSILTRLRMIEDGCRPAAKQVCQAGIGSVVDGLKTG
jgi:hypothetical protein